MPYGYTYTAEYSFYAVSTFRDIILITGLPFTLRYDVNFLPLAMLQGTRGDSTYFYLGRTRLSLSAEKICHHYRHKI